MTRQITHRCPGSIAAGASIRFQKEIFDSKPRWWLLCVRHDFETMVTYIDKAYPIEYCPFCGKELNDETQRDRRQ